ncbi:uncharacterized protein LOC110686258 [Chenopodium quinoa]|uniref:uncharacterized protein LOC110686258 n=1 Tax=Chenopodium quinoa TaxID=63459 RepID=UPI000B779090|nr:uncharacterized protein LOC110686258 [Chenopodium quinoa]
MEGLTFARGVGTITLGGIVKAIWLLVALATNWGIGSTSVTSRMLMGINKTTITQEETRRISRGTTTIFLGIRECNRMGRETVTPIMKPLEIEGKIFPSDLIEFGLSDFDLILGMDWLSKYNAEISCRSQKVKMITNGNESVTYWMNGKTKCPRIISVLKLAKYVKKGHLVYFCSVRDMNHEQVANPENIEVVNEFLDVFSEEIPGMPPKRAIDFTIDLVPETAPISKAPYRMAPAEMSELKDQLQDLLDRGYIRPSASPCQFYL